VDNLSKKVLFMLKGVVWDVMLLSLEHFEPFFFLELSVHCEDESVIFNRNLGNHF